MTKRVDVRLRWFDDGAPMLRHALNQLGLGDQMPPQGDFYACPACLKAFPREAAIDGRLTEEHVPPDKLGGKRLVLTCDPCNSGHGHDFDAHAIKRARAEDFLRGKPGKPVDGVVHADGKPLRGEMHWTEDGSIQMFGVDAQNDSRVKAQHVAAMDAYAKSKDSRPNVSITARLEPLDEAKARYSWIRAAYLAAFAALGYGYILRPKVMGPLRDQLANPDASTLPTWMFRDHTAPPTLRRILAVDEPDELRCVAVIMGEHMVFLPAIFNPRIIEETVAAFAARRNGEQLTVNLGGKEVPWPRWATYLFDRPIV